MTETKEPNADKIIDHLGMGYRRWLYNEIWSLMWYAQEMKINGWKTQEEKEYWQGRADAFRVTLVLLGGHGTEAGLVLTTDSKHMPDVDWQLAEKHRIISEMAKELGLER